MHCVLFFDMLELNNEIIRQTDSSYSSPMLLIPKKVIFVCFDLVGGNMIYSTLDLNAGYWQMRVAEEYQHKTAFRCYIGHYEFNKVPWVLKSAPNFFLRNLNKSLADLVIQMVYIDCILVYTKTN